MQIGLICFPGPRAQQTMFCTDDDESNLKATVVHPNEVLDIDVSPGVKTPPSSLFSGAADQPKNENKAKYKERKSIRLTTPIKTSAMKRGDPFLPSVFSDENPIADYTIKKNSRKKPSDCKCKGFGYNVSPSSLLPEEMRQQWGVGMFGKPTLIKTNSVTPACTTNNHVVITPSSKECELKCNQVNINRNGTGCSSSKCVLRCKNCREDPCLCTAINRSIEGFRIPDNTDRKKQKNIAKNNGSLKSKDMNKSPNPVVLTGNSNCTTLIKRIPCYNSKENSNIISTSNFHRTPMEPPSSHNVSIAESVSFKGGLATSFVGARPINPAETQTSSLKGYRREDITLSQRARHRHHPFPTRRILANISPSPILTSSNISGSSGGYERKKTLSMSTPQMIMMGSQSCACESCRRRASLVSRMEAMGFSTQAQQMLSPYLFTSTQRYQPVLMSSPLTSSNRYAPYTLPSYGYTRNSGSIYRSPERYQCSSPTYYDYSDISSYGRQPFSSTPLSMANEINKIEASFLDSENSLPSPPSSGYVEDITDLSIQDTVDFFVSMKSPFVNSSSSPVSDSSPGMYSTMSPVDRCTSPNFPSRSMSCFCAAGNNTQSFSIAQYKRDSGFGEPSSNTKYNSNHEPASQPISLLYSSLVTDLEDELQCAIENIPTV
ncbi:hypothetical protein BgiBS90_024958 [Biomphalaria glabrata]|nr:hypothetical protein BgiBS90_024958 [Biomphalaria glabrata]